MWPNLVLQAAFFNHYSDGSCFLFLGYRNLPERAEWRNNRWKFWVIHYLPNCLVARPRNLFSMLKSDFLDLEKFQKIIKEKLYKWAQVGLSRWTRTLPQN